MAVASGPATSDTAIVRNIVTAIERHLPLFVSSRSRVRRQLAAAGLARCVALLEGMCLLREGRRGETMGILLRSLFETWLVSNYVLLKGKDADDELVLIELGSDFARSVTAMAEKTGRRREEVRVRVDSFKQEIADHPDNVATDPAESGMRGGRLKIEQLASVVTELITARDGFSMDAMDLYNTVYRGESTYSTHLGLATLHSYMDYDEMEENDKLQLRPKPPFPNQDRVGALLTLDLAFRLFKEFGITEDGSVAAAYEDMAREGKATPHP